LVRLYDVLEWLKTIYPYNYTAGKIDRTRQETICALSRNANENKPYSINGKSYYCKGIRLILRAGKRSDESEAKAGELFGLLYALSGDVFSLAGLDCFIQLVYSEPVSLYTDETGVYEYAIDFDLYVNKGA
jgi:hypothetical protein